MQHTKNTRSTVDQKLSEVTSKKDLEDTITAADIKSIKKEIKAFRMEFQSLKEDLTEIKSHMHFYSEKLDDVNKKMSTMENHIKRLSVFENNVKSINQKIETLEQNENNRSQREKIRNIEIIGLPQTTDQNLYQTVQKITNFIGFNLRENDVDYVYTIRSKNQQNATSPVILQLTTRRRKEEFLSVLRSKSGGNFIKCGDIGFTENSQKIYFNEHLTLQQKILYKQTRDKAKLAKFRFTWIRNGLIFAREKPDSPVIRVSSSEDLKLII